MLSSQFSINFKFFLFRYDRHVILVHVQTGLHQTLEWYSRTCCSRGKSHHAIDRSYGRGQCTRSVEHASSQHNRRQCIRHDDRKVEISVFKSYQPLHTTAPTHSKPPTSIYPIFITSSLNLRPRILRHLNLGLLQIQLSSNPNPNLRNLCHRKHPQNHIPHPQPPR